MISLKFYQFDWCLKVGSKIKKRPTLKLIIILSELILVISVEQVLGRSIEKTCTVPAVRS